MNTHKQRIAIADSLGMWTGLAVTGRVDHLSESAIDEMKSRGLAVFPESVSWMLSVILKQPQEVQEKIAERIKMEIAQHPIKIGGLHIQCATGEVMAKAYLQELGRWVE